jgi:hypothetical protein
MNKQPTHSAGCAFGTHLGVLAGIAVATGIIVGALAAGDSVRGSLHDIALRRLGSVESALASNDRFFRAKLADDMAAKGEINIAPVLLFRGIAVNSDTSARANNVQIIGVDERFWKLGSTTVFGLKADKAVVNHAVAAKLGLKVGDEFVIRFEKPGALPSDMPLISDRNSTVATRVRIKAVASNAEFGRFSLRANQAAALNVFVPLQWLGEKAGVAGKANVLLAGNRGQRSSSFAKATEDKEVRGRRTDRNSTRCSQRNCSLRIWLLISDLCLVQTAGNWYQAASFSIRRWVTRH